MNNTNSQVYISRLLIRESGEYHNQYIRPYTVSPDGQIIAKLERQLADTGAISPIGIAKTASEYLVPSAVTRSPVNIVGGWNHKRFRFMMEVVFRSSLAETVEVVSGYTDYQGISLQSNLLDPNMVLIINSVVPIIKTTFATKTGTQVGHVVHSNNHVISAAKYADSGDMAIKLMTPASVSSELVTREYAFAANQDIVNIAGDVLDYPSFSRRNNTNPNRYMANMLNAYRDVAVGGYNDAAGFNVDSNRQKYSEVRASLFEDHVADDSFMTLLQSVTGSANRDYVTIGELQRIDPNVLTDQVTTVMMTDYSKQHVNVMETEHLAGSDAETLSALSAANIVPSIMMDYGLIELSFSSTNNVIGGQPHTIITNIVNFGGSARDLTTIFASLTSRLENELISIISHNNMVMYDIDVHCNIIGETVVWLGLATTIKTPFVIPTFADSLFNPIITNNRDDHNNLVDGFTGLFGLIDDIIEPNIVHQDFVHLNGNPPIVDFDTQSNL